MAMPLAALASADALSQTEPQNGLNQHGNAPHRTACHAPSHHGNGSPLQLVPHMTRSLSATWAAVTKNKNKTLIIAVVYTLCAGPGACVGHPPSQKGLASPSLRTMPQAGVFSVNRLTAVASLLLCVPQAAPLMPPDSLSSFDAPRGNVPQAFLAYGSSTVLLEHPPLTHEPQSSAPQVL